jgi:signal transduction histidine kinase/DNA-binding response OmpR family regulator
MSTHVTLDHSIPYAYPGPSRDLTFTLEPDQNLIEVDMTILGRDGKVRLGGMLWMEGVDQRFNRTVAGQGHLYMNYQNLRPGTYELIIRPEDEQEFIDVANQSAIKITVIPYWYNRWWAYAAYVLAVAGLFLGFYRLRIKGVRLEQTLFTERLRSEQRAELESMRSRFFANVTHELRTPLTLILGPTDILLTKTRNTGDREQLGFIQRNARRLLRSVELLLDLSRLESGTVQLKVTKQDGIDILRRITGYFSSASSNDQKPLRFHAPGYPITGFFDAEKLEHILQNLISNALKFTSTGDTIDVQVWKEIDTLCFSVKDTGPGIAAEHLPRIFDRFYRVDETHTIEGTGIGLSLTKELVEIHRGSIEVDSTPGKGTAFTVRIPLDGYASEHVSAPRPASDGDSQRAREIVAMAKKPSNGDAPIHDGKPILLIAEDNDDARQFILSQLSEDYHVLEAVDGEEAINATQHQIPDLIISDVMMPNKDGHEVCRAIKGDERTSHIPIILLTALSGKDQKISGLNIGADDYLDKPFDIEELKVRARNLIQNRKKMRDAFMRTTELRPGQIHATSLDDRFLKKALDIVEQKMSSPEFDVSRFAREMFLSSRQLNRKLSAITNYSASEFIRHVRLQRAKDLLEQHSGSVAEIADSVGFSNHSYFAKVFSEKFGSLPSQFLSKAT